MSSLLEYKTKIIECTQWLSKHGYFGTLKGTGGNVSMRLEAKEAYVITPSGLSYDQLTPKDMCVLDFDMTPIEGELKPSIESGFHLETYKRRPDIFAVIHTHQIHASTLAVLNKSIPPLFDEVSLSLGHIVDVIPYALSGSPELIENVAAKLDNMCHAYLMQNHGALSLGATLEKAWLNVELLEKTSKIFLSALASGLPLEQLPKDVVDFLKELRKGGYTG